MSQKTKTQFIFTIIPFRLMREHKLLTSAERDMLIQIISFGESGCFYSIEGWRKITERGDQTIYRGLYKLQLLGIISIYKGNRRAYSNQNTSNLYRYKPNPADWNLPVFLQEKLNSDLKTMGKEPIEFKDGFKSLSHFINSFNTLHPLYAIKNAEPTEAEVSKSSDDEIWIKRMEKIMNTDFFFIARQFHYYEPRIKELQMKGNDIPSAEKAFLELLRGKYTATASNPQTDADFKIMELISLLTGSGENSRRIDQAIIELKMSLMA